MALQLFSTTSMFYKNPTVQMIKKDTLHVQENFYMLSCCVMSLKLLGDHLFICVHIVALNSAFWRCLGHTQLD